jgi:TPR repeat protein
LRNGSETKLVAFERLDMWESDYLSTVILFLSISCAVRESAAQVQAPVSEPLSPVDISQLQTKARAGDSAAELELAKAYEDGNGVPQSDNQALKWYRAAAEQGNATAQNDVGIMFSLGRGVEQDKMEAVKWYRKAAREENPNALFNMGTAYSNGDGVGIDDVWAYAWFLLAQSFGSQPATDAVNRMKDGAAGRSQSAAFERIGDMYQKGDDLPQSSIKAVDWYRKAAEDGGGRTQMKLASLLLEGQSATLNYGEVRRLCQKAASLKFPPGAYCMGQLYEQGAGSGTGYFEGGQVV